MTDYNELATALKNNAYNSPAEDMALMWEAADAIKSLIAERDALAKDAATAAAIERAAKELPEYYNITIELERGYGGVRLSDPNNEVTAFEFDEGDAGLSDCINEAIDAAIDSMKGTPT